MNVTPFKNKTSLKRKFDSYPRFVPPKIGEGFMFFVEKIPPTTSFERTFRWVFPKIVVPQNGWFINGKPYEQMDDLGG